MKILIANKEQQPDPFFVGLYNAFVRMGFQVAIWNKNQIPAFDVFNKLEPDLLVDSYNAIDRATVKCIVKRPKMKVIVRLDNNRPAIGEYADKFRAVYITSCELPCENSHLVRYAVDDVYFSSIPNSMFDSDNSAVYVGNFAEWKLKKLQDYIMPVDNQKKFRIFGSSLWSGIPQYCGVVSNPTVRELYNRTLECLDFVDEGQNYIGERCFHILGCGNYPKTDNPYFSDFYKKECRTKGMERQTYLARATQILELVN